jgi:hypothetical protein
LTIGALLLEREPGEPMQEFVLSALRSRYESTPFAYGVVQRGFPPG